MKKILLAIMFVLLLTGCESDTSTMSDFQLYMVCFRENEETYKTQECIDYREYYYSQQTYTQEEVDEMFETNRHLEYINEFNTWCTSHIASERTDDIHNCITFIEALDELLVDFDFEEDWVLLTENEYTDLEARIEELEQRIEELKNE